MPTVFPSQPIVQLAFPRTEWPSLHNRCWPPGCHPHSGDFIAAEVTAALTPLPLGFDSSLLIYVAMHLVPSELQVEALHPLAPLISPGMAMTRIVITPTRCEWQNGPDFEPVHVAGQAVPSPVGIPIHAQGAASPVGYAQPAPGASGQVVTNVGYDPVAHQLNVQKQPVQRKPLIFRHANTPDILDAALDRAHRAAIRNDGQPTPSGWRDRPPLL